MSSSVKIAVGLNNAAGLAFLEALSPPLLALFGTPEALLSEWHDFEGRELAGTRVYVNYGRPWCAWIFDWMTRAEMAYLRTTFASNLVTIRTLNKATNTYGNYNATLVFPDLGEVDFEGGLFEKVRLEFHDLVGV